MATPRQQRKKRQVAHNKPSNVTIFDNTGAQKVIKYKDWLELHFPSEDSENGDTITTETT